MRDPHVQWCERLSPSPTGGGAGYSISGSFFFLVSACLSQWADFVQLLASSFYFF